jgi:multidrug efflux pump subunit AcrB
VSFAAWAVQKRTVTVFATAVLLVGGIVSYKGLGKLEDPEFTVKTAVVTTTYPGATADEVELEVTDRIEIAIQEMPQVKEIESFSRAGFSLISVEIIAAFGSDELPQIWDELRKKIRDVRTSLPPGAGQPAVSDDFGDVYGFLMAVVGDGFTWADLERHVDHIKKELSVVEGVARVELWGVQQECVYLDAPQARLSQLGLAPADVMAELAQQNTVIDAGGVDVQDQRMRIEVTGEFSSPEEIGDLVVRGTAMRRGSEEAERLIRIRDIADIRRGYVEPTNWLMRYDGQPAIGVSAANKPGVNIIELGRRLDRRLNELLADLPVGIEVHRISWQGDLVAESIDAFMVSLFQAVAIVLIVLWVAMGLRTALIVGMTGLVFTIIGSFLFMKLGAIDLQRMSLGALIIAMGMMVDNAIVVSDGILVRMQQGMDRVKAAVEAATQPAWPLLGATFVAVAAFYPIAASDEAAGEYCATLFSVVAIALMLSWVLSVTITPVLCISWLPAPKRVGGDDVYGGRMYRMFRGLLGVAIRLRWVVLLAMVGLLVAAGVGFRWVPQMFFPESARPQFMVDYWAPEGTRIQEVAAGLKPVEQYLLDDARVSAVSTFVGQGPPRFYLPVDPESPYPSYGQLIVNVRDYRDVDGLINELKAWRIDQSTVSGRAKRGRSRPASVALPSLTRRSSGRWGSLGSRSSPPARSSTPRGRVGASGSRRSSRTTTRTTPAGPGSPGATWRPRRSAASTGSSSGSTASRTSCCRSSSGRSSRNGASSPRPWRCSRSGRSTGWSRCRSRRSPGPSTSSGRTRSSGAGTGGARSPCRPCPRGLPPSFGPTFSPRSRAFPCRRVTRSCGTASSAARRKPSSR